MDPLILALLALTLVVAIAAAVGAWRGGASATREDIAGLERRTVEALDRTRESTSKRQGELAVQVEKSLGDLKTAQAELSKGQVEQQSKAFTELQDRVRVSLGEIRTSSEEKLEKIRTTVDEKLQSTLEKRLGESFRLVSERLEQVHKGLGEMRELASGVGDLKRVLTNVRSRGTFGEVQLAALLEQVMAPSQYDTNVATVPGSSERVEFAIRLPGRDDGQTVWLPIDAKFPQEDYLRLQQAYEAADAEGVEESRKALRTRMVTEAKRIQEKYVSPPATTEFAILFIPTEGLYAEVLRIPGLTDELQTRLRVVPAGPTTLWALLNSLRMGFQTLAIEKRSSEVWKVLGAVKAEFSKFGSSLDAVGKKLREASNKIEDTGRRTRAMERQLRDVEALPEGEAAAILPPAPAAAEDNNSEDESPGA